MFAKELLSWKASHEITPIATSPTILFPMPVQAQRLKTSSRNTPTASGVVEYQKPSFLRPTCRLDRCFCFCHDSTIVSGKQWSIKYPRNSWLGSCNRKSCTNFKKASLWISLSKFGIHYAVLASLDIMWGMEQTSISPSLQVKRVVNWDSPAFAVLRRIRWGWGDWDSGRSQLVTLFEAGKASPFDILPDGTTIIEVSSPNDVLSPWIPFSRH